MNSQTIKSHINNSLTGELVKNALGLLSRGTFLRWGNYSTATATKPVFKRLYRQERSVFPPCPVHSVLWERSAAQ